VQIGPMVMATPKPRPAQKPGVTAKMPVRNPEPKPQAPEPTPREAEALLTRPERVAPIRSKPSQTEPIPASALRIHMPALWQTPLHPSMMLGLSPEAEKAMAEARKDKPVVLETATVVQEPLIPEPDAMDASTEYAEPAAKPVETKSGESKQGTKEPGAQRKAKRRQEAAESRPAAAEKPRVEPETPRFAAPPPQPSQPPRSFMSTSVLSIAAEQPVEEDQSPITLPNILFVDQQPVQQGWFAKLPVIAKMGMVVAAALVAGGLGMLTMQGQKEQDAAFAKKVAARPLFNLGAPVMGDTGWQAEFISDPSGNRRRDLAFFPRFHRVDRLPCGVSGRDCSQSDWLGGSRPRHQELLCHEAVYCQAWSPADCQPGALPGGTRSRWRQSGKDTAGVNSSLSRHGLSCSAGCFRQQDSNNDSR